MPAPTINIGSREKVTGVVELCFAGQLPKDTHDSEGALFMLGVLQRCGATFIHQQCREGGCSRILYDYEGDYAVIYLAMKEI